MKVIKIGSSIDVSRVFQGDLSYLSDSNESQALSAHALDTINHYFGKPAEEITLSGGDDIKKFAKISEACKSNFTNGPKTQELLKKNIIARYGSSSSELLYDVPRLRIIPNSKVLSSGISYNYQPHRDSWYGAGQDQINHWMAICNVTNSSTFYIAPTYFDKPIGNQSQAFDLENWDLSYRDKAVENISKEDRPHPLAVDPIPMEDRLAIVFPPAWEIVFSGCHLHGSGENTVHKVRFSLDYRVYHKIEREDFPANMDSKASGNFRKYLLPVTD